jgi:hypothetical protein
VPVGVALPLAVAMLGAFQQAPSATLRKHTCVAPAEVKVSSGCDSAGCACAHTTETEVTCMSKYKQESSGEIEHTGTQAFNISFNT